jgi:flagellar biosynthetic protein FliO
MGLIFGLVVCPLWASSAFVQDATSPTAQSEQTPFQQRLAEASTPSDAQSVSVTSAFIRVVVALVVVLGVIAGLAYLLRRMSPRFQNTSDGVVRVLAQVPLGPSQFLSVVDIAGTVVVLGVTDHNVTALSEVEDAATANQLRENASRGLRAPLSGSFKQWLRRAQQGELDR